MVASFDVLNAYTLKSRYVVSLSWVPAGAALLPAQLSHGPPVSLRKLSPTKYEYNAKSVTQQMRVGWRCSSVSLTLLLVYAASSLVFLRPPLHAVGPSTATNSNNNGYNKDQDHHWGRQPRIRSASGADSIVFVALGPAARSTSLLYALTSLREEGRWDGAVHVIVEHEDDLDCLSSYLRQSVTAIAIPPPASTSAEARGAATEVGSTQRGDVGGTTGTGDGGHEHLHDKGRNKPGGVMVTNAKMAKMQLLDLLPPSVERVVYVDCDVITQRPLGPFLDSVSQEWKELDRKVEAAATAAAAKGLTAAERSMRSADRPPTRLRGESAAERPISPAATDENYVSSSPSSSSSSSSTMIIFEDAGGHTIPMCWGCDRAHSGVVALARGHSERCLELWHDAFRGDSGKTNGTDTDQEALDVALRPGSGCEARWLGRQHLSFMKDAFVMAGLTRTSTFGHFTGLLHPERLGVVHRRFYEWALGRGFGEWGRGEIEACAAGS